MASPLRSSAPENRAAAGGQFVSFAVVGAAGTGVHYAILLALVTLFGVGPGVAAFAGAAVGACVVYLLNRRFTFNSTRQHRETFPRFAALAIFGALLNGGIVAVLSRIGLHFLLAQVVATIIVLFINFVVSKKWIYR